MQILLAKPEMEGDIAALMYSAGPELYDFIYKTKQHKAQDFINFEFKSGRGFCGYPNVTVGIVGGKVVATGCFYDGKTYPKLVIGTFKNMLRFYGPLNILPLLTRLRHIDSVMTTPKRHELYLANFGVDAVLRSQGIGSKLLSYGISKARQQGYQLFSLDVADTNPRAQALYEKTGLRVRKFKLFSGHQLDANVPNAKKMELQL